MRMFMLCVFGCSGNSDWALAGAHLHQVLEPFVAINQIAVSQLIGVRYAQMRKRDSNGHGFQ